MPSSTNNNNHSVTKTFGILTAGGDCPGLNAAIRGVCRAAYDRYGMKIIGFANGFKGLIDEDYKTLTPEDVSGILTVGGTILGSSREKPFESVDKNKDHEKSKDKDNEKGKDHEKNKDKDNDYDVIDKVSAIKETYSKLGLDCLVILGGNGTHTTGYKLSREGLNIIGLPKTIDNDIFGTDRTFGFDSALDIGTEAIDRLHSTARSHNRVIVIELMGNKAGWLSLYAGIAGGGDVVLIPEIPYDMKVISNHLEKRAKSGKGFSIVVVAEGAMSTKEAEMEKKERKKYRLENGPSIGYRIAREIQEATGMETRATVLGYVQRGGEPSASDRVLTTSFGTAAAELLAKGQYNRMVALLGNDIGSVDLSVPEGKIKNVPIDHYLIDTARAVGTCMGDQ